MSPENENETPEPGIHEPNALKHSYDEQCVKWGESSSLENAYDSPIHGSPNHVKWGFNEWIIQLGAKSGAAPDHIGNRSESNRVRSAPNRGPSPI